MPSRFELSAKSGARLGQSLDIHNVGLTPTEVSVRTLDWGYSPEGEISYLDALQPGSCRPWVLLERKTVKVPARGKTAFRFQIEPPADAPRGECRFMLAIEGVEPAYRAAIGQGGASLSLPVTGRIAVAVYVLLNGAEPRLALSQVGTREVRGQRTPYVTVSNTGDAHGRLDGSLDATDAAGARFEMVPEGTPVLPGQTRLIPLSPKATRTARRRQGARAGVPAEGRRHARLGERRLQGERGVPLMRHARLVRVLALCAAATGAGGAADVARAEQSTTTGLGVPATARLKFTVNIDKFVFFRLGTGAWPTPSGTVNGAAFTLVPTIPGGPTTPGGRPTTRRPTGTAARPPSRCRPRAACRLRWRCAATAAR
jgi:fimbrial chaperone protein